MVCPDRENKKRKRKKKTWWNKDVNVVGFSGLDDLVARGRHGDKYLGYIGKLYVL